MAKTRRARAQKTKRVAKVTKRAAKRAQSKARSKAGDHSAVLIYVTCPDIQLARAISKALIEEKLAACTNIFPQMESHYRWQGQLRHDNETVLLIKSTLSLYAAIEERVRALHSYEVPCILALTPQRGWRGYLDWIKTEVSG